MTPDQISALTAIAAIVSKIGTWPIGSIVAVVVLGPWIAMFFISRAMEKRQGEANSAMEKLQLEATSAMEKRQEAVIKMYENNVELVKSYEKVAKGLQDIIVLSTQTMTQVRDRIDANLFCPLMRKDPKVEKGAEKPL